MDMKARPNAGNSGDNDAAAKLGAGQVPLVKEFLVDHQRMSQLMLNTLVSLEEGEDEEAIATAKALDRVAGPHIAYEESELYPRISGGSLVSETTELMYLEHRQAVEALKKLLDNPRPNDTTKHEIVEGLRIGIAHVEHCGSLVSLLAALPEAEQKKSLQVLLDYRDRGRLWTDRIR